MMINDHNDHHDIIIIIIIIIVIIIIIILNMTLLPPYESIAVIVRQKKKSFADLFSLGRHGHRFYLFFIRSPLASLLSFASFHSDCISIPPSPPIAITFPH